MSNSPNRNFKRAVIRGTRFLKKHSPLKSSGNNIKKKSTEDIVIAVDAMGGDNAPHEIIKGAVRAAREFNIGVQLVGQVDRISRELAKYEIKNLPIEIVHAPDVIGMEDKQPARAVAKKPDASVVVTMRQVASGQAHGAVSAGSTGAAGASALFCLGRINGIDRPGIAATVPTTKGDMILIDAGANVDSSALQIGQHALMGSIFASAILGLENPRVGLLNIGEEPGKGNIASKQTFNLLEKISSINFVGNVEGRTLSDSFCDVLVADGFVGNIFLKTLEGSIKMTLQVLHEELTKSIEMKMGAFMCKPAFRAIKHERLNYAKYGGAVLLGVQGVVVIAHGISNDFAIMNAIKLAADSAKMQIVEKIGNSLKADEILAMKEAAKENS